MKIQTYTYFFRLSYEFTTISSTKIKNMLKKCQNNSFSQFQKIKQFNWRFVIDRTSPLFFFYTNSPR